MSKNTVTPLYMLLGAIFTSCLLISNIVANKLIQFGPWSLTSAVIIFPLSYILGDVITEVYGFKAARRVMWLGFAMNALMVLLFTLISILPVPVWFEHNAAYATVLGNTPRLFAASMLAYILGSWINAVTLSKLKVKTNGRFFGLRAVASTLFGETIDSLIFVPVAFIGKMPFDQLLIMMGLQIAFKTTYEIVILPVTHYVVKKIKKVEGINKFDHNERYNLFG
jgi:uncharacterized integral membrane protein (TIGR00697 family)